MKKLLFAALLSALATAAHATTYWVSPTGSADSSGVDSTTHAKSLAWVNANADSGDVIRFKCGAYSDPIKPVHQGRATKRIRFYGNPLTPGATKVTDIDFSSRYTFGANDVLGDYITAKWFAVTGGSLSAAYGYGPTGDSLVNVIADSLGDGGVGMTCNSCVFDSLHVIATMNDTDAYQPRLVSMVGQRTGDSWDYGVKNSRLTNCNMSLTVSVGTSSSEGSAHFIKMSAAYGNVIYNNTFSATIDSVKNYFFMLENYEAYNNLIQGNTWTLAMTGGIRGARGIWCNRDSSSYNRFLSNTVTITGTRPFNTILSNSGHYGQSTVGNYYGHNTIKSSVPLQSGYGVLTYYDGCRGDTLEFNTVSSKTGAALMFKFGVSGVYCYKNTLLSYAGPALALQGTTPSASKFKGNVYASRAYSGSCTASETSARGVSVASNAGGEFGSDSNYFAPPALDRAASYVSACGTLAQWRSQTSNDAASSVVAFSGSMFMDSRWATLDLRPNAHSLLYSSSAPGGYYGALAKP